MKTRLYSLITWSFLATIVFPGFGDDAEMKDYGGVQIRLIPGMGTAGFGAMEFDPEHPDHITQGHPVFSLEIINGSNREISVPAKYDGNMMRLWGGSGENSWPLKWNLPPSKETMNYVRIAPGAHYTGFSFRFSELFSAGDSTKKIGYWSWWARPASPVTPIHRRDQNKGYVSTAVFWAEFVFDNQRLRTEPVIIEIKPETKLSNSGQSPRPLSADRRRVTEQDR
jgi:hypothetical protein